MALRQEQALLASGHPLAYGDKLRALAHLVTAESGHSLQDKTTRDSHLQQALDSTAQRNTLETQETQETQTGSRSCLGFLWCLFGTPLVPVWDTLTQCFMHMSHACAALACAILCNASPSQPPASPSICVPWPHLQRKPLLWALHSWPW